MIHDHALMIHYEKHNQQAHIKKDKFTVLQNSIASYMFWPPIVAIFREVFFEGYITKNVNNNLLFII
jgi:hypothetical protein